MLRRFEKILLFLITLFLPTQLGKHFWPEFSQIHSLHIDYLSPTIYFWDLLVIALIFIFLLQRKKINKWALNLFLLFILAQVMSLVQIIWNKEVNLGAGLARLEQYLIAGFFGVYIASKNIQKISGLLFWSLSFSLILQSLLALGQFYFKADLGMWFLGERGFNITTPAIAKFDFYGQEFLRPYATFPHPNVLAGFMVVILPILLLVNGLANKHSFYLKKLSVYTLASLAMMLSGLVIFLTVSRVALVCFLIMGLVVLRKAGLILLGLSSLFFLPVFIERFTTIFTFDNLSLLRREELANISLELFKKSVLWGVGLNNFIPMAADSLLVGPSRFLQPAHNIYLLTLAETGLIGFLGLFCLIVLPIFKLTRPFFKPKSFLIASWVILLFLGLFDHYFLTLQQGYRLMFLLWGISFAVLEYQSV
ncbi:O-antigen ligase family protein [Candidatus Daviesbacteria bacterium]|nr:O-antigen ligase family protein [Candidatus Daviesbacteria bacterium]